MQKSKNLIGFCGYGKFHARKNLRQKFYNLLNKGLRKSPRIKNKKALEKYYENYDDYVPENLAKKFDGEISILILDKKFRGQGFGKNMIQEIFVCAKKAGLKNLEIMTDESCSFGFYEKLGCEKVFETTIKNSEPEKCNCVATEQAFVYEKKL